MNFPVILISLCLGVSIYSAASDKVLDENDTGIIDLKLALLIGNNNPYSRAAKKYLRKIYIDKIFLKENSIDEGMEIILSKYRQSTKSPDNINWITISSFSASVDHHSTMSLGRKIPLYDVFYILAMSSLSKLRTYVDGKSVMIIIKEGHDDTCYGLHLDEDTEDCTSCRSCCAVYVFVNADIFSGKGKKKDNGDIDLIPWLQELGLDLFYNAKVELKNTREGFKKVVISGLSKEKSYLLACMMLVMGKGIDISRNNILPIKKYKAETGKNIELFLPCNKTKVSYGKVNFDVEPKFDLTFHKLSFKDAVEKVIKASGKKMKLTYINKPELNDLRVSMSMKDVSFSQVLRAIFSASGCNFAVFYKKRRELLIIEKARTTPLSCVLGMNTENITRLGYSGNTNRINMAKWFRDLGLIKNPQSNVIYVAPNGDTPGYVLMTSPNNEEFKALRAAAVLLNHGFSLKK